MLNAELKSMNSILTYESLFSRWGKSQVEGGGNCIIRRAVLGGMQTGADRVCWGCWF